MLVAFRSGVIAKPEAAHHTVEPKAEAVVRHMCTRLKTIKSFKIEASDTVEDVLDSGQKVQYSHSRIITVSRPDRLVIKSSGDIMNRELWKDGKTITILDRDHNVYAQIKDPGTIDDMMDVLLDQFGVTVPLADLLSGDAEEVLLEEANSGMYLGLHQAGGQKCHHVAFTREDIDWQAWVGTGKEPHLRKLVITYKDQVAAPQYSLMINSLELPTRVPAEAFQFQPPEGCRKIEFHPLRAVQPVPENKPEKVRVP